ncbi:MAG: FtsX-like permease family protein [Anaerolineales bacterium]
MPNDWAALNGLRVGSKLTLSTGEVTQEYTVAGLIRMPSDVPAPSQPTAWVPLEILNTAFNTPETATAILLRLRPGFNPQQAQTELLTLLGDQYFVTSASGGGSITGVYDLLSLALPVAGFAVLLAGAFLVFNAFAITLAERKREIGQLRTLGMTRGQVLTQTLGEAGLIGLLGSLLGLLLGWLLGRGVTWALATLQDNAALTQTPIPPDAVPLALGAGVFVTLAVTFNLARQAARISPLVAMKNDDAGRGEARLRPYSLWLGLGLLAVTAAAYLYAANYAREAEAPNYGLIFLPVLIFGAAVLSFLPAWLNGILHLARRLFTGATARLAWGNVARASGRAALTAATLVISFMLIIALTGITLFISSFLISFNSLIFANQVILMRPFAPGTSLAESASLPTMPPIPSAIQAEIEALSDEAEILYTANVSLPGLGTDSGAGDRYAFAMSVNLFREKRIFPLSEGSWAEVARAFEEHEPAIYLPELTARKFSVHPGDLFSVKTLEGPVDFYVAGVGGAFPVVSPASGVRYFGSHPNGIIFGPKPGVDAERLEARVIDLQARHSDQLTRLDSDTLVNVVGQLVGPMLGLFTGLTSLSGLVAALGFVVTIIASVLERQRELGTLRALGMRRAQVRQVVLLEAGVIGLAGASLGALGGLGMAWLFAQSMNSASVSMMNVPAVDNPSLPWPVALAAVVIGPLVAVLAALWPADRAANVNPAEAMRAEGATGFLKPAQHLGPTGVRGFLARLPLAAKLSLASGLILVVALAAQTAVRVNAERQLIEDNLLALLARSSDPSIDAFREQLPAEMTELTPDTLAVFNQQVGAQQAEALQAQFRRWRASQTENDFQLLYFFITDLERNVIYSDEAEWLGRVLTDTVTPNGSTTAVRLTSWFGERVFEGTMPIENQAGQKLGYLQAGLSAAPIDNFIRDVITSSLWTMALTLLAAIALTVWFTQRALTPVAQIAQASKAVARGDLSQRVPETNWDEVGSLARSFNDMVKGLNERERMRDLFGRYLSREVSEAVLSGKVTLTGERKTITCLYVDMRGSTAFAEKHAPEDVMAALNQYFEVIILATEAHGGIVNRFVGDQAVCVFGAPTEYRDHADRALQAALAMREGLAYLNQKRAALGLPTLKFGMGLNTGEVVAGATGSEERQEYTVIGDAMNVGARIQSLTKEFPAYDILLSEFTRTALGDKVAAYALADLGPTEIHGKTLSVRIFGPIGKSFMVEGGV